MAIILSATHTAQEPTQINENMQNIWTYFFSSYMDIVHIVFTMISTQSTVGFVLCMQQFLQRENAERSHC